MENNILNGENSENSNQENSSFFDEKVSSSNSNEGCKPTLRFDEFCSSWQKIKLGAFCHIVMGQSPDSNSYNDFQQGLPLVQGNADIKDRITAPQRYTTLPTKVCEANSIIMSVRAPVGTIALSNQKICLGRGVCAINTTNNSFLYQYLLKSENSWKNIEQGGTFTAINSNDIKNFQLYITTLKEQQKIADFLSLVDKRINKQRQLVENLKKYKRGLLSAIFERKIQFSNNEIWLEKKLKEVCNGFDNQRKPISAELREKGQIPYYGANGIQDYVKDYIFDGEYVLLAEDGGHFDEFSTMPIAQFINGKAWVNNHAHILQGKEGYNTKFIYYALVHKDIRKYINGTSRAKLNQEDMWDIQIVVPSFKLQIEIVEYFSKFDEIIKAKENCLKNLEYLKKGFLQQMFI